LFDVVVELFDVVVELFDVVVELFDVVVELFDVGSIFSLRHLCAASCSTPAGTIAGGLAAARLLAALALRKVRDKYQAECISLASWMECKVASEYDMPTIPYQLNSILFLASFH
jgi:hypothetical protein